MGALAALRVFREVSKDRVIVAMIVLAGLGSFFVGSAIQTAMPAIATSMDGASGGTAYGVLLFANGLGGVLGGLLLEGTGWLRLSVRAAMWSTAVYGLSSALFAFSHDYLVAALLLVVGGVANLAAMSITQTVVQLLAPREKRGQVVGLYGVAANGLRIGSGFTVGLLGAVFGLRVSLGVSALAMVAGTAVVAGYLALGTRRQGSARTRRGAGRGGRVAAPSIARWPSCPRCRKTGEVSDGRRTGIYGSGPRRRWSLTDDSRNPAFCRNIRPSPPGTAHRGGDRHRREARPGGHR